MTVRPVQASPHDAAVDAVVMAVDAARRRLRIVSALQLSALAVPAGVALGAALSVAGWAPLWTAAALAVFGATAAAVWAAGHTPSIDSVARTLDTRLGLRDRVAAALQLRQTGGPIATLVARDAAARLAPVNVTTLFPLALGRAPAVALTVAVALVAWDLATGTGRSRTPVTTPTATSESANTTETPRRAPEGSRAAAETGQPDSQPRPVETTSQPRNDPQRAGDSASAATAVPGLRQPAAPTATESTGRSTSAARHQQAESAPAASTAGGRGGRGGSAAGLTPRGPSLAGAGGAAAGNEPRDFARGRLASAGRDLPLSASSLAAARASAEAALGRDVIPPDYRDHVRAYFSALPSSGTVAGGAR